MSIANELSSEVASAVLSRKDEESSAEPGKLKDVVMSVHSALREMRAETRRKSLRALDDAETPAGFSASNGQ
jgi:hypothetical protein